MYEYWDLSTKVFWFHKFDQIKPWFSGPDTRKQQYKFHVNQNGCNSQSVIFTSSRDDCGVRTQRDSVGIQPYKPVLALPAPPPQHLRHVLPPDSPSPRARIWSGTSVFLLDMGPSPRPPGQLQLQPRRLEQTASSLIRWNELEWFSVGKSSLFIAQIFLTQSKIRRERGKIVVLNLFRNHRIW